MVILLANDNYNHNRLYKIEPNFKYSKNKIKILKFSQYINIQIYYIN